MLNYLLRRTAQLPLVLFGVSLIIFGVTQVLSPEVRATAYIRSEKQVHQIPQLVQQYGLDRDLFTQYRIWLSSVLQGNLGWSTSANRPVLDALAAYLPATAELALVSLLPIVVFGVLLGVVSGVHRDRFADHASRVLSTVGYSLPSFVVGIFLLALFYGKLRLLEPGRIDTILSLSAGLPTVEGFLLLPAALRGQWAVVLDVLHHLILPVLTLTIIQSAVLIRIVRSNIVEQLQADFVRTAHAKGLHGRVVVYKHALRNALIPVITVIGTLLYGLLGGVAVTETVFDYPGIGKFAAEAALRMDIPAVLGFALFAAAAVAVINLVVDVTYGLIDPRVRYE